MRPVVVQASQAPLAHRRPSREAENRQTQNEQREHRHLHLERLDFFAEIFRRAPDHQARDKNRKHDEHEHSIKSRADTADDDFAELDVEQRHKTTKRREGIMHRVDRAARRVGGHGGEQGGIENAEADFLAFHVAIGGGDAELLVNRVAFGFRPPAQQCAAEKKNHHGRPDRPAVSLIFRHASEVIRQPAADGEDGQHLQKV